jgi:hypothetical protein
MGPLQEMRAESAPERDEIRLGCDDRIFFFSYPGRSAARVLRAGVSSTLHGVVFAFFVQAVPYTAEGTLCRVQATRSLVPRAYQANRSNPNTSCARQRDRGYSVLAASVAVGRPCAPGQARTMPASCALPGHDELLP